MTTAKNKNDVMRSIAWLIEAAFRAFIGYWLLDHSHNYVVVVAAIYSLLTAGIIVVVHFVNAHK